MHFQGRRQSQCQPASRQGQRKRWSPSPPTISTPPTTGPVSPAPAVATALQHHRHHRHHLLCHHRRLHRRLWHRHHGPHRHPYRFLYGCAPVALLNSARSVVSAPMASTHQSFPPSNGLDTPVVSIPHASGYSSCCPCDYSHSDWIGITAPSDATNTITGTTTAGTTTAGYVLPHPWVAPM